MTLFIAELFLAASHFFFIIQFRKFGGFSWLADSEFFMAVAIASLGKLLMAIFAVKRSETLMCAHMVHHVAQLGERLLAFQTLEDLILASSLLVRQCRLFEAFLLLNFVRRFTWERSSLGHGLWRLFELSFSFGANFGSMAFLFLSHRAIFLGRRFDPWAVHFGGLIIFLFDRIIVFNSNFVCLIKCTNWLVFLHIHILTLTFIVLFFNFAGRLLSRACRMISVQFVLQWHADAA